MKLKVENKVTDDFINSLSVGGRNRNIEILHIFLRKLKYEGILKISLVSGEQKKVDFFTKKLTGTFYNNNQ